MTQQELMALLDYCPVTGVFTWKLRTAHRIQVGDIAGSTQPSGYITVRVAGVLYYAHRLAVLYMTGTWPVGLVDHNNRVRHDNRWSNLKLATAQENQRNAGKSKNNTSGVTGVIWDRRRKRWFAQITIDRKSRFLGYFDDISSAALARKAAECVHNFHPNHGTTAP